MSLATQVNYHLANLSACSTGLRGLETHRDVTPERLEYIKRSGRYSLALTSAQTLALDLSPSTAFSLKVRLIALCMERDLCADSQLYLPVHYVPCAMRTSSLQSSNTLPSEWSRSSLSPDMNQSIQPHCADLPLTCNSS